MIVNVAPIIIAIELNIIVIVIIASKEEPVLVWKILGQYEAYNVNTKRCLLCLNEKLQIAIYRGNNMLNKRTEIISKCRHRNKYALSLWQSDFTVVKKIGINSIYFNNFKNRCILCDVYSTHVSTIIHVDTFHGSKGDFLVSCAVTSCKIRNHYIVANLTVVVHSAEDCCASSMKL